MDELLDQIEELAMTTDSSTDNYDGMLGDLALNVNGAMTNGLFQFDRSIFPADMLWIKPYLTSILRITQRPILKLTFVEATRRTWNDPFDTILNIRYNAPSGAALKITFNGGFFGHREKYLSITFTILNFSIYSSIRVRSGHSVYRRRFRGPVITRIKNLLNLYAMRDISIMMEE